MFQINEVEPNVFRANFLNEDDINSYIQLHSVKTRLVGAFFLQKSLLDMFVGW